MQHGCNNSFRLSGVENLSSSRPNSTIYGSRASHGSVRIQDTCGIRTPFGEHIHYIELCVFRFFIKYVSVDVWLVHHGYSIVDSLASANTCISSCRRTARIPTNKLFPVLRRLLLYCVISVSKQLDYFSSHSIHFTIHSSHFLCALCLHVTFRTRGRGWGRGSV